MTDFPSLPALDRTAEGVISTANILAPLSQTVPVSTAWPSANLAIFVPFRLAVPQMIYKLVVGAGSGAGNFDVGVFDSTGVRYVASGATAKSASAENIVDIADTEVGPGTYYLAMSADGVDNYVMVTPSGTSPVPLQKTRLYGVVAAATAYPLPASVTLAAATLAPIPWIAAYLRPH